MKSAKLPLTKYLVDGCAQAAQW